MAVKWDDMHATTGVFYTYYQSPAGLLKIGATDHYVNELSFIDNKEQMIHGEPGVCDIIHECTEQLIEYFNGRRRQFSIPVHQEGTSFQQQVWNELLHIPFGETATYLEIAKQLGDEKAVRAVGNTNGKNKIAIIIPCHRVIGSNKSLIGYAGGLIRKKWLLQHEFRVKNGIQTLF
jgi:methylated-DNA-[protein]-cysteine S-methyltransferase